jgi:hypothetical protein
MVYHMLCFQCLVIHLALTLAPYLLLHLQKNMILSEQTHIHRYVRVLLIQFSYSCVFYTICTFFKQKKTLLSSHMEMILHVYSRKFVGSSKFPSFNIHLYYLA